MRSAVMVLLLLVSTAAWSNSIIEIDNSAIERGLLFDNDSLPIQTIVVPQTGRVVGIDLWLLDVGDRGVYTGSSFFSLSTRERVRIGGGGFHSEFLLDDGSRQIGVLFPNGGTREFSFQFANSSVVVDAGDVLELSFSTSDGIFVAGAENQYSDGTFEVSCSADGCSHPVDSPANHIPPLRITGAPTILDPYDVAFRLYIETPEPALLAMLLASAAILVGRSRRGAAK